jgi:hypothetical protein
MVVKCYAYRDGDKEEILEEPIFSSLAHGEYMEAQDFECETEAQEY